MKIKLFCQQLFCYHLRGTSLIVRTVSRAMNKVERKIEVRDDLDRAGLLLETLPLSTEEFSLASNRLWNAGRYVKSGEYGAAHWELRTLRMFFLRQEADVADKSGTRTLDPMSGGRYHKFSPRSTARRQFLLSRGRNVE
mgnify:CR=1 FL=1